MLVVGTASVLLILGALRLQVDAELSPPAETGRRGRRAVYIGRIDGVTVAGREIELPETVLGLVPGTGLVTAPSREALAAGDYYRASGARWVRVDNVLYRRRRQGYPGSGWEHETRATEIAQRGGRWLPVLRHTSPQLAARVCDQPGDFICEG